MTLRQRDFIASLIQEREVSSLSDEQVAYLSRIEVGEVDPTPAQASRIIETLLVLPKRDKRIPGQQPVDVATGRYAVVNSSGVTEFFKVDCPEEGKWAGYVFVKQQVSDDLYPVKGARKADVLARIAADPDALARYGQELGVCGRCGRTLTDEVSRAMGIGPECAKIIGAIRPSVEEVVAPAATPPAPVPPTDDEIGAGYERKDSPTIGWRERKRLVKEQQHEDRRVREERPCSQNQDHPGCDIFGAPL